MAEILRGEFQARQGWNHFLITTELFALFALIMYEAFITEAMWYHDVIDSVTVHFVGFFF